MCSRGLPTLVGLAKVGCRSACGARDKNRDKRLRDSTSAKGLCWPGICMSGTEKLWWAAVKKSSLSSFMIATFFDDWPDQTYTMAWLSQWNLAQCFARQGPHTLAAATIAKSSCH